MRGPRGWRTGLGLAATLGLAQLIPGGRARAGEPTITAWRLAGDRGWKVCDRREREAERVGISASPHSDGLDHEPDRAARQCPHALAVISLAARKDATWRMRLPEPSAEADWDRVVADMQESRGRALLRLRAAGREAARQGKPLPREHHYWRARALLGLGRVDAAAAALEEAKQSRTVRRWKIEALGALIAIVGGDLDEALELSQRAVVDAPRHSRARAYLVHAMALDRAEDTEGTLRAMALHVKSRPGPEVLHDVETTLPVHERLYLRALTIATRAGGDVGYAQRFFEAYLSRPEPEAPDRKLAERHVKRLRDMPARLGG